MMKTYIRTILLTCCCVAAASLTLAAENMDAPRFELGLRGGVAASAWTYYDADALLMPQGGLSLAFRIARVPLYLETGVYYVDKGARVRDDGWGWYDDDDYLCGGWWSDRGYGNRHNRYAEHYSVHQPTLQIPLLVSYHHYFNPTLSIRPFAGFYVAPVLNTDDAELFADNVDVGLKVGCGMGIGAFYAGFAFDFSSAGYDHDWDYEGNATLSLTLGINFATGGNRHHTATRHYQDDRIR